MAVYKYNKDLRHIQHHGRVEWLRPELYREAKTIGIFARLIDAFHTFRRLLCCDVVTQFWNEIL